MRCAHLDMAAEDLSTLTTIEAAFFTASECPPAGEFVSWQRVFPRPLPYCGRADWLEAPPLPASGKRPGGKYILSFVHFKHPTYLSSPRYKAEHIPRPCQNPADLVLVKPVISSSYHGFYLA